MDMIAERPTSAEVPVALPVPVEEPDFPWLIPWTAESFDKMHRAGARVFTASQVPSLFEASRFSSRYATCAHVWGIHTLPEPKHDLVRAGKRLERVAIDWAYEEHGLDLRQVWGYARHPKVPLLASPDAVGDRLLVEVKTVNSRTFDEHWSAGPPLGVKLQHQTQFACLPDWRGWRGRIIVQVIGDWRYELQMYETEPHEGAIARIEGEVERLAALLETGALPPPDDQHRATADALRATFEARKDLIEVIDEPEAMDRFIQLLQGRADEAAGKKASEAAKLWFLSRAKGAGVLALPDGSRIVLKTTNAKEKVTKAHKRTTWTLIGATGDDQDGEGEED